MKLNCGACEGAGELEWCACHLTGPVNCPNVSRLLRCEECDGAGEFDVCSDCHEDAPIPNTEICTGCLQELQRDAAEFRRQAESLEWLVREVLAGRLEVKPLKAAGGAA